LLVLEQQAGTQRNN